MTITQPAILDFRWKTAVEGAQQGFWQLIGPHGRQHSDVVLASGNAGNAPGGIFTIDLGKFFPATPPLGSSVYQVRVQPFSKMILVWSATPGVISKKVPAKAVGQWSEPVIITYATTDAPPVPFDFTKIYRKAHFHLDAIEMVDDQVGPGAEEFYVAAFVKESFPKSSSLTGKIRKMGPYFAELQPYPGSSKLFEKEREFNLNNPDQPEWPRSYAAVITVLEVDDGGTLVQWQEALWDLSKELTSGTVAQQVSEFLEELKEDLREDVGAGLYAEGWAALVSMVAASTGDFIVAYIALIVTTVAAEIAIGAEDDYYGTEAVVLGLLTNVTDYIQSFPGTLKPDGSCRHQEQTIRFKGYPTFPTAAAWDGVVDIIVHWEFSQKQDFEGGEIPSQ